MPFGALVPCCVRHGLQGSAASILSSAVFWTKAKGSNGTPTDGSGNGHAIALGNGAGSNVPTWLPYSNLQYLWQPGVSGAYVSAPDSAALSIAGAIDLQFYGQLPDWTPATTMDLVTKSNVGGNNRSYALYVSTDGKLNLDISVAGVAFVTATSSVATGIADGTDKWVRATWDGSTTATFYTSTNGSSWSQLGTTVSLVAASIGDSGATLNIGARDGGTANLLIGKVYRVRVYNGISGSGGTKVFDADLTDDILVSPTSTTFTETGSSATCTINFPSSGSKPVLVNRDCFLFSTTLTSYLQVADTADLDFGTTDSMTVVILCRVYGTTASQCLFAKRTDPGTADAQGWELNRGTANAGVYAIGSGLDSSSCTASAPTAGANAMYSGVRKVASDNITLFVDSTGGTPVTDLTTATLANALAMRIGAYPTGTATYGDFVFLAAAVFRSALTSAQLTQLKTELLT